MYSSNNRITKSLPLLGVALIVALSAHIQRSDAFLQSQHHRPTFGIPTTATNKATSRIEVDRLSSNVLLLYLSSPTKEDGPTTVPSDVGSSSVILPDDGNFNMDDSSSISQPPEQELSSLSPTVIRCPLKYLGPYPAIALRFPQLATQAQRSRNVSGISLDFVLDTAANLNTLNGQVASELQLQQVGEALPGIATSGPMAGGNTYMLGDTELERGQIVLGRSGPMNNNYTSTTLEEVSSTDDERESTEEVHSEGNTNFLFMENLTASVMPVSSPASAGLLSLAFLYCFEGGVEFQWGKSQSPVMMGANQRPQSDNSNVVAMKDGLIINTNKGTDMPCVTFYGEKDDDLAKRALEGMTRVVITPIPITQLPSILVTMNGIQIPALLDTGSPITVLNHQAAERVGIKTIDLPSQRQEKSSNRNPFAAIASKVHEAQAMSKAVANGDVLTIGSMNGPVNLLKSLSPVEISVLGDIATTNGSYGHNDDDDDDGSSACLRESAIVSFGENRVFVGDIPGLQALNGIGVEASPAVVLGMDFLRQRPKMLFRAQQSEVYF
jgi:hypothetical protein